MTRKPIAGAPADILDDTDVATILAGLRCLQQFGGDGFNIEDGDAPILDDAGIDDLCERINFGAAPCPSDAPAPADPVKAEMLAALRAMWDFATTMQERHGMNGDDTMTDADHEAWRDAAGKASSAIARAEGRA